MASYSQPGGKRQKVREARVDNVDYFQGIEKLEFNNMATPSDTNCYRHYNHSERVHSRTMDDWLRFSVSFTEFRNSGSTYGKQPNRPWEDSTNSLENYKRCLKAFFDFCLQLNIKYWTAFDTDLVPMTDGWEENKAHWDEIVEFIQELHQRTHVKLLWIAPDLHSYARYTSGALTSNEASTFIHAATQIKKCLEISQKLNAENFLIWPHREGYISYFQTDLPREIKLFSKLLKMTADYKERLNYRCQLLIMPYSMGHSNGPQFWRESKWRENYKLQTYMWDVTSCLYFLKSHNLDRYYKVCTPPGHHMYMANVYNMLGGVTITDYVDHCDSKLFTLMMKCIVDQGTVPPGGINLKLSFNRDSDLKEMITYYAKYIDNIARALRIACNIISEQICSKHVQRYSSYYSGIGARITSGEANIEECEDYYRKDQLHQTDAASNKLEHFNMLFQRYLHSCDHV